MTAEKAKSWALDNGLDPETVYDTIRRAVKTHATTWAVATLKTTNGKTISVEYTSPGWRWSNSHKYAYGNPYFSPSLKRSLKRGDLYQQEAKLIISFPR